MEFAPGVYKIVLSKASRKHSGERPYIRADIVRNEDKFQASMYTSTQVFHKNFDWAELQPFVESLLGTVFKQCNAWDDQHEYSTLINKAGKTVTTRKQLTQTPRRAAALADGFNRQKNHIIREGEPIPVLVDMGIFTKDYKVHAAMRDKFHQINRFLELLADETSGSKIQPDTIINIVDFGCGKSYLTFLVYHYFAKMRDFNVKICGLDLNPDVVKTCSDAAEKYEYSALTFKQGDIGGLDSPPVYGWGRVETFNIVICLHACNTATDYAIFKAIQWNADLICAVPCCQYELRAQMKPQNLKIFSEYGIIEERIASLATDAIRARLLELMGYKTQIIEFTAMEHTPKNLLIRARKPTYARASAKNKAALEDVRKLIDEFSFQPKLLKLLEGAYDFV